MRPPSQSAYCTTREAAQLLGISLRTAQLWVENGQLDAWKTEGGHRRISRASVQRLLDGGLPTRFTDSTASPPAIDRLKVLVVEDDNILLKLYKTVLSSWKLPIDVITANNGIEGLILIGRDAPDLMITDLAMPGMDGFQLIHSLAGSSLRAGMDIAVVSGLDAADIEAKGGLPRDVRLFSKPVPFDELRALAAGLIERRAAYL
ncbi:MAG: response regulator [Pseudomonadota bacterium]